jgi:hypothetical protein
MLGAGPGFSAGVDPVKLTLDCEMAVAGASFANSVTTVDSERVSVALVSKLYKQQYRAELTTLLALGALASHEDYLKKFKTSAARADAIRKQLLNDKITGEQALRSAHYFRRKVVVATWLWGHRYVRAHTRARVMWRL